jgi:hypothetical protein
MKSLLQWVRKISFKSKQEVSDTNKYAEAEAWLERQYRSRRFSYYANIFDVDVDSWLFEELTEKQSTQLALLWRLVDLEGGQQ